MSGAGGYIKLHRPIQNHWIWNDERYLKAWLDIILTVQWGNDVTTRSTRAGGFVRFGRAEYPMSLSFLGKRWSWSEKEVRTFLSKLVKDGMISKRKEGKQFVIKVTNYDEYNPQKASGHNVSAKKEKQGHSKGHSESPYSQPLQETGGTINGNERAGIGQEVNKDKKDKKDIYIPTLSELQAYCLEKGYSEGLGQLIYEHYSLSNWRNNKDKPIKSWKQTVNGWINNDKNAKYKLSATGCIDVDVERRPINRTKHPAFPESFPYVETNIYLHERNLPLKTIQELQAWQQ